MNKRLKAAIIVAVVVVISISIIVSVVSMVDYSNKQATVLSISKTDDAVQDFLGSLQDRNITYQILDEFNKKDIKDMVAVVDFDFFNRYRLDDGGVDKVFCVRYNNGTWLLYCDYSYSSLRGDQLIESVIVPIYPEYQGLYAPSPSPQPLQVDDIGAGTDIMVFVVGIFVCLFLFIIAIGRKEQL